nr:uncharacterized protein LOC109155647 [Ipomoea trifida]
MDFNHNPDTNSDDICSHLNARMERNLGTEDLYQNPVNIIHEVPNYQPMATPMPYPYAFNPMGIPELTNSWWQHAPHYYAPPMYQFQPTPQGFPQPTFTPAPNASAAPPVGTSMVREPELRRVQSERRPPQPRREPSVHQQRSARERVGSPGSPLNHSPP